MVGVAQPHRYYFKVRLTASTLGFIPGRIPGGVAFSPHTLV